MCACALPDWYELNRMNSSSNLLPGGAILPFREWELTRWIYLGGATSLAYHMGILPDGMTIWEVPDGRGNME